MRGCICCFPSYGGIEESITTVGEFYKLFDGCWVWGMGVWLSMGASKMHRMLGLSRAIHMHVFRGLVHCMSGL